MGGKPFQSKGCHNCRQRKVKCDTARPNCMRCRQRGIQCHGYDKKFVFVPQSSVEHEFEEIKAQDLPRTGQMTLRLSTPPKDLSLRREQLVSSYINMYFPVDIKGSISLDPWYTLMSGMVTLPNKPLMLELAVAATSCIYLGKISHDESMLRYGLRMYNGAIHHVSHELSRNNHSDELFYTIGIFQVLMTIHCPYGLEVLLQQIAVTDGILKQCLSHETSSPITKSLCLAFQRMRLLKTLSPLEQKEAIGLSTEISTDALVSNENQPVDRLFYLMSGISSIAAAVNTIDISQNEACQVLLHKCLTLREDMLAWYSREVGQIGGGPSVCESGDLVTTRIPPSKHLFGLPYRFVSLDNARIHILLWAALSMLQTFIGQAHARVYSSDLVDARTNREYQLSEYYADEISRAIPYCLQDSMRVWGLSGTVFGMCQIAKIYMDFRREEKFFWSQQLFKTSGDIGTDLSYRMNEMFLHGWALLWQPKRGEC